MNFGSFATDVWLNRERAILIGGRVAQAASSQAEQAMKQIDLPMAVHR